MRGHVAGAIAARRLLGTLLAAAIAACGAPAQAQQAADRTAPPAYRSLRYEEDYRYLQDPARRADFLDALKYIRLAPDPGTYLSFGGELRERFEWYSQPNFGLRGHADDRYLLHRLLLHADLHVTDYVRFFVQLGDMLQAGKQSPLSQTDVDRLDLQQAFLDVRLPLSPGIAPLLRVGRQEIAFGSQRLVSVRESPNTRRSFDGVRLSQGIGPTTVDAFITRPVVLQEDVFDDHSNQDQVFWGVYTTTRLPFGSGAGVDLYYLGFRNDQARFGSASGIERRHTIGARIFGSADGWDWNLEPAVQFGAFSGRTIRAWTVASETGFTFARLPWAPRIALKANVASGDGDPGDGSVGTFNPLFPKLAYFNEASLIAPSNFFDVYPTVTVRPVPSVSVTLGWDFLWRYSTQDAIYTNPFTALAGTAGTGGRRIGDQISLDAAWQVDRHLQLSASYVHFNAGSAVRAVGGRDVDFAMVSVAYRF